MSNSDYDQFVALVRDMFGPRLALTPKEFQQAFGMGHTKFYADVKDGKIRTIHCGRKTLVTIDEAARYAGAAVPGAQ